MLTIYRASAGAGKTHRLTGEFLILLFTTPGAFRRILAVTFTNKATEEMKKRVIDELYNLSSGKQSEAQIQNNPCLPLWRGNRLRRYIYTGECI